MKNKIRESEKLALLERLESIPEERILIPKRTFYDTTVTRIQQHVKRARLEDGGAFVYKTLSGARLIFAEIKSKRRERFQDGIDNPASTFLGLSDYLRQQGPEFGLIDYHYHINGEGTKASNFDVEHWLRDNRTHGLASFFIFSRDEVSLYRIVNSSGSRIIAGADVDNGLLHSFFAPYTTEQGKSVNAHFIIDKPYKKILETQLLDESHKDNNKLVKEIRREFEVLLEDFMNLK